MWFVVMYSNSHFLYLNFSQYVNFCGRTDRSFPTKMQASVTCEICGESFPSKTKLFKHLELHGFEGNNTKHPKIILLVGWLSDYMYGVDDNDTWEGDVIIVPNSNQNRTSEFVEKSLFKSIFALENGISNISEVPEDVERPKSFSRGSSSQQRSSFLQALESSCHSLCDTFCFQSKRWLGEGGDDEWVALINKLLPSSVRVLKRYVLTNAESSEFHGETSCSQRVYEFMLPLTSIVPEDDGSTFTVVKTRNFTAPPSSAIVDTIHSLDSKEGRNRIAFFRKLKTTMKKYGIERRSLHNFAAGGACPDEPAALRKVDRFFHKEMVAINGESWAVFSISGDALLKGQVRKMLGLSVGIARGWLPEKYFDLALHSDTIVDLPSLPGWGLYLAECRFAFWEAKYVDSRLDPRRRAGSPDKDLLALDAWKRVVHEHIASISSPYRVAGELNWIDKFEHGCRTLSAKFDAVNKLNLRSEEELRSSIEIMSSTSAPERIFDANLLNETATLEEQFESLSLLDGHSHQCRILCQRLKIPETAVSTVSYQALLLYDEVLRLLREADHGGRWPQSSTGRQKVITEGTLKETGGQGGSFSVGSLPLHLAQPKGNSDFPGLFPFY